MGLGRLELTTHPEHRIGLCSGVELQLWSYRGGLRAAPGYADLFWSKPRKGEGEGNGLLEPALSVQVTWLSRLLLIRKFGGKLWY